jgi:hypothetical protein
VKVWLVRTPSDPYEPWDVDGVFSSLEKAVAYRKTLPEWQNVDIEEWEVDNPGAKILVDGESTK